MKTSTQTNNNDSNVEYSFVQRQAMRMARWPKTHFWVAFVIAFGLSAFGMIVGNFSVSNEEGGWTSRGTLIGDRTTQILMVQRHADLLFASEDDDDEGVDVWEELTTNVQPGWEENEEEEEQRRRLALPQQRHKEMFLTDLKSPIVKSWTKLLQPSFSGRGGQDRSSNLPLHYQTNSVLHDFISERLLQELSNQSQSCGNMNDPDFLSSYMGNLTSDTRLWPVWKTKDPAKNSALDPALVEELCLAEESTQQVLQDNGLCIRCDSADNQQCLPPYGIVLFIRLLLPGGMDMDCTELAQAWGPYQTDTESSWTECVQAIEANPTEPVADICPPLFYPSLVDELFDTSGTVHYTSTIFATSDDMVDDLYAMTNEFGKASNLLEGVYDTQGEDFVNILADEAVGTDMLLACGSALITTAAIFVHTRSLFLTIVALVQILLSFPLAFFAYRFLAGYDFFPFLNFIGVFVVFALGADHVFVAVDKFKNARLDNPSATTEEVAAKALPDAASAMLLTTATTAVAFFGTAICPVAPVRLFAIFCGLLILFDYIMDVLLIFPCLCIYDGYRQKPNCCITCHKSGTPVDDGDADTNENKKEGPNTDKTQEMNLAGSSDSSSFAEETTSPVPQEANSTIHSSSEEPIRLSLVRRILLGYYNILHMVRWPLLLVSAAALGLCTYYATKLKLPLSSDVRLINSNIEYEKAAAWRKNLLSEVLTQQGGSLAYVMWGVTPADTGDHNDPASWTTLELDESFDPTTVDSQVYLRDYCPRFFAEEFAGLPTPDFECSMNLFDAWLKNQSSTEEADDIYFVHCANATGLPMRQDAFSPCMVAWSKQVGDTSVLSRNGVVEIMSFAFNSLVRFDSPNSELEAEWNRIEEWMKNDQDENAPEEAANAFFSSSDFWWFDTNLQMFRTAYGSAGIAIAASALVILLSSRSLVMTLFSVLSIGYVLASVTSMMVAAGWTLGFLESVCFAILIGVSVDFVIHFSHAYVAMPGEVGREVRTKHALIDMGPSILAAAFTTMAGAVIMLFCLITFFTKFAFVLFFTIVQATIGSFVVFLTLTDCIGPAQPTYMADQLLQYCKSSDDNGNRDEAVAKPDGIVREVREVAV